MYDRSMEHLVFISNITTDTTNTNTNQSINHMLGDILISTQLLVTHLVTTFSVGDNRDIVGI